ncbi:aldehyde dehydrogenase [Arthrobacter sp. I2-34]|uniref:Aldehyde dehydrogenase n=1 Tax=Arthrobacter hankyongi TaxID=2904801 RepID=A0ABS9L491_9MICC|nr:aldehyde dehydrogenase [Arthrobacter hankyongi]MCG2621322.1 aldehyde dehydrogenase [Arthrobacter hankyongi]
MAPQDGEELVVRSPATEEVIGTVATAGIADMQAAIRTGREFFDSGSWQALTPVARAEKIRPLAAEFLARTGELAELMTREMGCPITYSRGAQVPGAALMTDFFVSQAEKIVWTDERSGPLGTTLVVREPVGLVAAVVPWNIPYMSILVKLIPALISGCSVIVKAAPEIALTAMETARMIERLGLPEGLVSVVVADRQASEYLVSQPEIDKVAFTGSTATGKRIQEICGPALRRTTLELGGKSAAIVLDDVDVDTTAQGVINGALTMNGQMCIAQQRVLVPEALYPRLRDAITDRVKALRTGDPLDEATYIGPLVAQRQRDRVEKMLLTAQEQGAKVLTGGGRPAGLDKGWFIEPTVFENVTPEMQIARDEVFGPVICLMPVRDETEALRIANDTEYGLSGAVWSADTGRALKVARGIRSGILAINGAGTNFSAPFGGFKQSGLGRELGSEGFDAFTEYKSIGMPAQP